MKTLMTLILALALAVTAGDALARTSKNVSGVVNINTATKAELMQLPGVGVAKADAILSHRAGRPFAKKDDLLAVKGIGPKMLETLAPYVVLTGPTTLSTQMVPATTKPNPTM
jgi:competence protein ComEA